MEGRRGRANHAQLKRSGRRDVEEDSRVRFFKVKGGEEDEVFRCVTLLHTLCEPVR